MQDISPDAPRRIFDFVIAGAGAAGLSLAASLKQALGRGANILVVDPISAAGKVATALRRLRRDRAACLNGSGHGRRSPRSHNRSGKWP